MIDPSIESSLLSQVAQLPLELQRRVLDFAMALVTTTPKGVPGKDLLRFAGTIDKEDLQKMSAAIEEGCEQVNPDEW